MIIRRGFIYKMQRKQQDLTFTRAHLSSQDKITIRHLCDIQIERDREIEKERYRPRKRERDRQAEK